MRRIFSYGLGLLLGLASCAPLFAQDNELGAQEVRDLRYGQVLYHLYQKKYFSAITDLLVSQKTHPISVQGEDPQLLLGALYLSYGMHHKASGLFDKLLDNQALPATHDRAWYYIGKLRYLSGHLDSAEQALLKIKHTLPEDREAERLNLLANTYLKRKEYDKAIALLEKFDSNSAWQDYARFNLGVALIRAGQPEKGLKVLDRLGRIELKGAGEELRALRDKANLAMGFAAIRERQPDAAVEHFSRIRLNGPLSNKALLGIGWARNLQKDYKKALVPWLELEQRSSFDPAVQEALLAIPYTYEKLDDKRLALNFYKQAIGHYSKELQQLQKVITAVRNGELIEAMRPANVNDETSLPRHAFDLPGSISAPYLSELMAGNRFQQAYKDYQDLLFLRHTLIHWRKQLPAYELMLKERQRMYRERLPRVAGDERVNQIRDLQQRRDALAAEVNRIEREQDAFALANDKEIDNVELLKDVGTRLKQLDPRMQRREDVNQDPDKLDDQRNLGEEKDKYNFLWGVMYWNLQQHFVPRLWQAKQSLEQLDSALAKARSARLSLAEAANNAPQRFETYQKTIDAKRGQIDRLLGRLDNIIAQHEAQIQSLALQALQKRQHQLENYHLRARFSMARLLDSLVNTKKEVSRAPD
jgi:outer membrane protein assembly factor BamD (BamD/ComL family)